MSSALGPLAPTRQNLLRGERWRARLSKGTDLLRHKRETLVTELFQLARPATDARAGIATVAAEAYPALLGAMSAGSRAGLRGVSWPFRDIEVDLRVGQVWGVPVTDIVQRPRMRRTPAARDAAPGLVGPAAAVAASAFERLADLLLEAAPREMLLQRLGQALAATSRQVNSLEYRITPALVARLGKMRRMLDEREREEKVRLARLLHQRARRAKACDESHKQSAGASQGTVGKAVTGQQVIKSPQEKMKKKQRT